MILNNLSFENAIAFYLLAFLFVLFLISNITKDYENLFSKEMLKKIIVGKSKKKVNFILMIMAFVLMIISLARPVLKSEPLTVSQHSLSLVVAFDISKSMLCEDVYPNRLEFAKNKFNALLKNMKDEKVGALGFSSKSFLIAPITNDYSSLRYLVKNINTQYINVKGSSVLEALKSTNNLLKDSKQKALIILSDGTDNQNFEDEITYANEKNIKVFVYTIATVKGGVIKTEEGLQKDNKGNIVITKLNNNIMKLAFETNGAYLEFSNSSNDIKKFIKIIRKKFNDENKKEKDIVINTNRELFYIPLGLALLFIFVSISGFKRSRT